MIAPNRNALAARVLADELARWGVQQVCLSPGSRSAPLALAFYADPRLAVTVHTDERCGAFFALGLARASGRPVVLVCTSGTAGANYLPAICEAFASRIPLVILTADRPERLRDVGAPQTMAQGALFGPFVRFAQDVGLPRPEGSWLRWLRGRVGRALEAAGAGGGDLATARGRIAGPVHLNLAFDEPLSDTPVPGDVPEELGALDAIAVFGRADGRPFVEVRGGGSALAAEELAGLVLRIQAARRPVVLAGPQADPHAGELASLLGAPLLADPLSGRRRDGAISGYDALVRDRVVGDALAPDLVVHCGRTMTSKHVGAWLARLGVERIVVDPAGEQEDPEQIGGTYLRAGLAEVVAALRDAGRVAAGWLDRWRRAESAVVAARGRAHEAGIDFEGVLVPALLAAIPPQGRLLVASSMPVRQVDAFWGGGAPQVLANRGVNGIDGLVSTAFGTAHDGRPTWALLGDLALLHDLGGLAAWSRLGTPLVLVVINNGGGGIFAYLPLAHTAAAAPGGAFAPLFLTPHTTDFAAAASLFGLEYARPRDRDELAAALRPSGRARLVEVTVDREDSVRRHRAFFADAAAAARAVLEGR